MVSVDLSGMTVTEALTSLGVDWRMSPRRRVRMIPRRGQHWSLADRRDRLRWPVAFEWVLVVDHAN